MFTIAHARDVLSTPHARCEHPTWSQNRATRPGGVDIASASPMAKGSTRVVCVALAGNVAIAAAKFGAYFLSGSSGMFTEAIHSLVDSIDQVLLLVGQARGRKPADATHPLGHGMEAYFWSFVVAIMVLMLGGGVSVYEGLQRLREPAPIAS